LPKYELLDHVSDVYVKASGEDLLDALIGLGRGLTSVLVRNPEAIEVKESRKISVEATDVEELVYLWLGELIYLFDTESFLFRELDGKIEKRRDKLRLRGTARGDLYDPSRHRSGTHVKAVTYHNMEVRVRKGGATVTVLLDI
jgi:SHS2 domain-containing protein